MGAMGNVYLAAIVTAAVLTSRCSANRSGGFLKFNRDTDTGIVRLGNGTGLPNASFSLTFWTRLDAGAAENPRLLDTSNAALDFQLWNFLGAPGMLTPFYLNFLGTSINGASVHITEAPSPLPFQTWFFVALTIQQLHPAGANATVFINGKVVGSGVTADKDIHADWGFGSNGMIKSLSVGPTDGATSLGRAPPRSVDELALWDGVLPGAKIESLFARSSPPNDAVLLFAFDDDGGDNIGCVDALHRAAVSSALLANTGTAAGYDMQLGEWVVDSAAKGPSQGECNIEASATAPVVTSEICLLDRPNEAPSIPQQASRRRLARDVRRGGSLRFSLDGIGYDAASVHSLGATQQPYVNVTPRPSHLSPRTASALALPLHPTGR